ncbi:MAG: hypothetical protein BWY70_00272 [Bacteroidetes bacterium ADurb.Bin408]|nr:MAG: hypothetical protein BWY70_00272 [Bacteroidetes bacterium ADurb.Bin408]
MIGYVICCYNKLTKSTRSQQPPHKTSPSVGLPQKLKTCHSEQSEESNYQQVEIFHCVQNDKNNTLETVS